MSTTLDWLTVRAATAVAQERAYVDLPVFTYACTWHGASEIIHQYNFAASNNFVLRSRPTMPVGANYVLCIRYRVGQVVYRYKLWSGIGEIGMDAIPLYNPSRDVIKANFVLEVWNLENGTAVSQATALRLFTSIKRAPGDITAVADYSAATGALVYPLTDTNVLNTVLPNLAILRGQYIAVDGVTWTDQSGNGRDLIAGVQLWTDGTLGDKTVYAATFAGTTFAPIFDGDTGFSIGDIFMALRQNAWNGGDKIVDLYFAASGDKIYLAQFNATPEIHAFFNGTDLGGLAFPLGTDYILHAKFGIAGTLGITCYDMNGKQVSTAVLSAPVPPNPSAKKIALSGTAAVTVSDLIVYGSTLADADVPTIITYLSNRTHTFANLPLTFDANAAGANNT